MYGNRNALEALFLYLPSSQSPDLFSSWGEQGPAFIPEVEEKILRRSTGLQPFADECGSTRNIVFNFHNMCVCFGKNSYTTLESKRHSLNKREQMWFQHDGVPAHFSITWKIA
ncbi:hypothetical protein Trydic_g22614 [Trypoxylus dichotomus]